MQLSFKNWLEVFGRDDDELIKFGIPQKYNTYYSVTFHVAGLEYQFDASEELIHVDRKDNGKTEEIKIWDLSFDANHNNSTGIIGTGNSLAVFQGVLESIEMFMYNYGHTVQAVTFAAAEISRRILYQKLAQRFGPKYEFVVVKSPTSAEHKDNVFVMARKEIANQYDFGHSNNLTSLKMSRKPVGI